MPEGASNNNTQRLLIEELSRRFPLFNRIVGRFGDDLKHESIPWFLAITLAAATKPGPGACCFVLDKTSGTTAVAAVLLAFGKLCEEFPELVQEYAQTVLRDVKRVRVKPSNFVYEYGGHWDKPRGFFSLQVLDEETSRRTFPSAAVLRLEPTSHVRPKGKLNSVLGDYERSCLDELLDLTTWGNNSLIRNSVLLYMPQAQFRQTLERVTFAPEKVKSFDSLSEYLPWGTVGPEGELKPNDAYQVSGEPIVAVTRVPEDLAQACISAPLGAKVVLVDGARNISRDLQAFDDVADRQRLVIFASPDETEALDLLKDRGCPIWHMSPDEILIGEASIGNRERASLVGRTIRAAGIRQRIEVNIIDCEDSEFAPVSVALERAAALIAESHETEESEEILSRLYGLLFECSECCFGVGEDTKIAVRAVKEQILRHGRWLTAKVSQELGQASEALEKAITNEHCGEGKADAVLEFVRDRHNEPLIVAARSPRTASSLRAGFGRFDINVPVLPVSAITPDREYASIIVPAWPNRQKFARLKGQAAAPDIRVFVYPFETKWVSRYQAQERARERSNRIDTKMRSTILGIESGLLNSLKHHVAPSPVDEIKYEPIFRIGDRIARRRVRRPSVAADGEESREAQLVQFFGDCYTILTEWAELPRLNQLVEGTSEAKLTSATVSKLVPGDYVLFRASGDKEFVRLIAEEILGTAEYERIRVIAERWKIPLQSLGTSPTEVHRRLANHGLNRTAATVGAWLNSSDRIGPRNFRDIEFIAKAAEDSELLSMRKAVEEAIASIRGAHISAGNKLTQLLLGELHGRLNELDEQPALLDLGYGEAWIVQVDTVEDQRQKYPWNLINRLLWADERIF